MVEIASAMVDSRQTIVLIRWVIGHPGYKIVKLESAIVDHGSTIDEMWSAMADYR